MTFSIFSTSLRRVAVLKRPAAFVRLFSVTSRLLASEKSKTLFIGGLNYDTTESALSEAFAAYSKLKETRIIYNKATNSSKGFGYLEFEDADGAEEALEGMQEGEIDGFKIRLDFAQPKSDYKDMRARTDPTNTIYLGNVPTSFTPADLQATLEKEFGELPESLNGVRLPAGKLQHEEVREQFPEGAQNMGFGYLSFDSVADAEQFVEKMTERAESGWKFVGDRTPKIDFARAKNPSFTPGGSPRRNGVRGGGRGGFDTFGGSSRAPGREYGGPSRSRGGYGDRFQGTRFESRPKRDDY